MVPEPAADIQAISSRYHDVQQEEGGGLTLSISNYVRRVRVNACAEAGCFQMMLY
jgi:hypothetical protein